MTNFPEGLPPGVIMIWAGSEEDIPFGWVICNGKSYTYTVDGVEYSTKTPDLRGRFIVGYSGTGDYGSIGNTGGSTTTQLTTNHMPNHTHSVTTGTDGGHLHTIDVSGLDDHNHDGVNGNRLTDSDAGLRGYRESNEGSFRDPYASHVHSFSSVSSEGSGSAFDNRPQYYTLAYIMKTHAEEELIPDAASDLSDTVDNKINEPSGLDTVESNLMLWLSATDIDGNLNSTINDGDLISEWKDISGNERNATQSDTARQPYLDGSLSMIEFDGVNDRFELPDGTIPAGNSNYTIIIMAIFSEPGNDWYSVIESGSMGAYSSDTNAIAINKQANSGANNNFIANYWWGMMYGHQMILLNLSKQAYHHLDMMG